MEIRVDPTLEFDEQTSAMLREDPPSSGTRTALAERPGRDSRRRSEWLLRAIGLSWRAARHIISLLWRAVRWLVPAARDQWRRWRVRLLLLLVPAVLFLECSPPDLLGPSNRTRWVAAQIRLGAAVEWPAVRGVARRAKGWVEVMTARGSRWGIRTLGRLEERWRKTGRCGPPSPVRVDAARWWQVARPAVNVRAGPGARYQALIVLGRGAVVRVTGAPAGRWLPVEVAGAGPGFVNAGLGAGLERLPCGTVPVARGLPICREPNAACGEIRRTRGNEEWVKGTDEGTPQGWMCLYLTPEQTVFVPER